MAASESADHGDDAAAAPRSRRRRPSSHRADSSGVSWAGRRFEPNVFAGDDGSAPPVLHEALVRCGIGSIGPEEVVAHVGESRFLIPLLAEEDEAAASELAVVTVRTPDGLTAIPAFTSVDALRTWDPRSRPVPVDGIRLALAAVSEQTPRVVLDPGADTEFVLRAPVLRAVAEGTPWLPPWRDERLLTAFMEPASEYAVITGLVLAPGDIRCRLEGPEAVVHLTVMRGLDAGQLKAITDDLSNRWRADTLIASRVDSIGIKLAPDPDRSL